MKELKRRLTGFFEKKWALPALCWAAAAIFWICAGLWNWAQDSFARSQGRLSEQSVTVQEFILAELDAGENGAVISSQDGSVSGQLVTVGGDPQMILENLDGRVVRTLSYKAEFDGTPREMCLYYTTSPTEPYSQDRRVFPEVRADGTYVYTLPRKNISALRLDPCSPDENKQVGITFADGVLSLNAADTLPGGADYLLPDWYELFCLVLLPALAAAALSWLAAVVKKLKIWKRK